MTAAFSSGGPARRKSEGLPLNAAVVPCVPVTLLRRVRALHRGRRAPGRRKSVACQLLTAAFPSGGGSGIGAWATCWRGRAWCRTTRSCRGSTERKDARFAAVVAPETGSGHSGADDAAVVSEPVLVAGVCIRRVELRAVVSHSVHGGRLHARIAWRFWLLRFTRTGRCSLSLSSSEFSAPNARCVGQVSSWTSSGLLDLARSSKPRLHP